MKEIYRDTDLVALSHVEALLNGAGIETLRTDQHTSTLFAGALGFVPQRILVGDDFVNDAARILRMEKIKPSCD